MNPLVSIIIPTYNRAHLISDTLNSVLSQTYTHWECLIIDDGSTDETETLINTFIEKDKRFQFHERPKDQLKGANSCRNYGFDISKGEFINWFDSDDIMMPTKLEKQIKVLQKNRDSNYCICQSLWFDKDKNANLGLRSKAISSNNRFEDYCLYKIFWLTTAPLWRREFINSNCLRFDESLHQSQEYDFHIKALAISDNYEVINEPLVTVVKHSDSISHNIYSDLSKMQSHIKVKIMLFDEYANKISHEGKLEVHKMLTLLFRDLLIFKHYKLVNKLLWQVVSKLKYLKISFYRKLIFSIKLVVTYWSYRIFGKGYNLIRPLK